jgi:trans-aconitate 2-methyltransferase
MMTEYWDERFNREGRIWGSNPSRSAIYARDLFLKEGVKSILVLGAGYGRNAQVFAQAEMEVSGIEISPIAIDLAAKDDRINYIQGSVLDVGISNRYDAIYAFNILHFFRKEDRERLVRRSSEWLKDGGVGFFAVFSEMESSFGKGREVENRTFESKPGRPVHYFDDADVRGLFSSFEVLDTGLMDDPENHGEDGPHVHTIRYIYVRRSNIADFDGEKYKAASKHQKEWGERLIGDLNLKGGERIIDLGCGDGLLTKMIDDLVPKGSVLGIDSSASMIETAKKLEGKNLRFQRLDIDDLDFNGEFDVAFSNAALHWVKDHNKMLENVSKALRSGGLVRFNFAGDGNCSNFFTVVQEVLVMPRYQTYFEGMEWPWFMPSVGDYDALVRRHGFSEWKVWMENADRLFTEDELVRWIDQPSIVPFLARVMREDKQGFRDEIVQRMLERTRNPNGKYFETFRRLNVRAKK